MLESSKIRQQDIDENQNEILLDLQREEAKEEEYDYFNTDNADENFRGNNEYHIMDENIQNEDEEEMLDDEERRLQNENMLRELREDFEREDAENDRF